MVRASGDPVDEHTDPRAGDGNDDGAVGPQNEPTDEHLEASGGRIVAAQALGERVRAHVSSAGPAHALRRQRRPSEILHEGQRTRFEDSQRRHRAVGTKRTRSPGCKREGGSDCSSKSTSVVRPSRCQPPGDGCG